MSQFEVRKARSFTSEVGRHANERRWDEVGVASDGDHAMSQSRKAQSDVGAKVAAAHE